MAAEITHSRHTSVWLDDTEDTHYPSFQGERTFDVAVIGGGITGLTTALLLARDGKSVCLVDQGPIATGTSGHTTAKVTSQHHLTYARIRMTHGRDGAATYGAAMEAAKERVAAFVEEGIECDFRRRPAYVYATRPGERALLERETKAAQEAGLPATLDDEVPLPFDTRGGMRFDNQVEIHARKTFSAWLTASCRPVARSSRTRVRSTSTSPGTVSSTPRTRAVLSATTSWWRR